MKKRVCAHQYIYIVKMDVQPGQIRLQPGETCEILFSGSAEKERSQKLLWA